MRHGIVAAAIRRDPRPTARDHQAWRRLPAALRRPHHPTRPRPWLEGNTGVRGFTTIRSDQAGPHVVVIALNHGNELAGAIALDALLRRGVRIERGRLTLGFANLDAFALFDIRNPTMSRFVDQDFNRLWDAGVLDGPRRSNELDRAREIRPLVDGRGHPAGPALHALAIRPADPMRPVRERPRPGRRRRRARRGDRRPRPPERPRLIDYARFTGAGRRLRPWWRRASTGIPRRSA